MGSCPGFTFRVASFGFKFQVSGEVTFEVEQLKVSGFGFQISGLRFCVSDIISDFRCRFRISVKVTFGVDQLGAWGFRVGGDIVERPGSTGPSRGMPSGLRFEFWV